MSVPVISLTTTLRVTGLPQAITGDVLLEHFSSYGRVSDPVIMTYLNLDRAPEGLVRFHHLRSAREALREENHVILGQRVNVVRNGPQPVVPAQLRKIFVGGIATDVTDEEDVENFFMQFGEIEDRFIPRSPQTGRPGGFALVVFRDMESVGDVLGGQASKFYYLKGKWVEVKRAEPRENTGNGPPRQLAG